MKQLIAIVAFTSLSLWVSDAFACQCQNRPDRDESLRLASFVFYGVATQTDDGMELKVIENFKGTRAKRTHKLTSTDDCAFTFGDGDQYIVFASKGEGKNAIAVDRCTPTTKLVHPPIDASIWTLADELSFETSTRVAARHKAARDVLTERAQRKIKFAANACDPDVWKANENVKARVEVRFDIEPDGKYTHAVLKYETPVDTSKEVTKCLAEKLAEDDFKSFPGGRVSVVGYWIIDRLDASFGQDRDSATIVEFKSDKHLLE